MQTDSEQLDLFAWPGRDGASRSLPAAGPPVRPPTAVDVEALPAPDLLRALERLLDGTVGVAGIGPRLIGEVARRRLSEAVPTLVLLCRLHAGFDRARAVPEVVAVLEALSALAAADAAGEVLRLVEQGAFGPMATAAALRFFAAVRHRPAARFARPALSHEHVAVRAAACALVAGLGLQEAVERLRELSTDVDGDVAAAAALACAHLGDHTAKPLLERRLRMAAATEIAPLARALSGIADADTVVLLGRAAERAEPPVRQAIVEALGQIEAPAAVAWLLRFAGDECPHVRIAAAKALAEHDDPRARSALFALADDADPEVRACVDVIVCEFGQPG